MKIKDIIVEANKAGKVPGRYQQSTRGLNKFSDGDRWNGDYTMYRLGLAVAQTDGKNMPYMDKESWVGKSKATFPYTKEEQEMLNLAYKAVNADYEDLNHGDLRSQECKTINKASVVANPKKNKYGI
jgi:hypothetical protein